MKTSALVRNGVSTEIVDLIGRLTALIPWPQRRGAMGDITTVLLDGKQRVAEDVFGWNRRTVELGIHEHQTGIACINDISARCKPKTEDKPPELLTEIQAIMEPHSESESSLRTTLLYTNMTARTVREELVKRTCLNNHYPVCALSPTFLIAMITGCVQWPKPKSKKNRRNRCHLCKCQKRERAGRCG